MKQKRRKWPLLHLTVRSCVELKQMRILWRLLRKRIKRAIRFLVVRSVLLIIEHLLRGD